MFDTATPTGASASRDPRPLVGAPRGTAIVVGAGWSGLAAAVGLVQAGWQVDLVDAAPRAGGRARALDLALDGGTVRVDNGQHLLIGAYRATLSLLSRIGVDPDRVLVRSRLRLNATDGLDLEAARLPAPLNLAWALLVARGLPWSDRIAMARLAASLRSSGADAIDAGVDVERWLVAMAQPESLRRRIWHPLCVGALNTPPSRACARTFARVLTDALLSRGADSDFLLPRATLSEVLPEPALQWLRARGATVRLRTPCRGIEPRDAGRWRIRTDAGELVADRLVLAVPPRSVARLLDGMLPEALRDRLDAFGHEPIATVWLAWRDALALPAATMLVERPEHGEFGQWLFRREPGDSDRLRTVAGVVISAAGRDAARPEPLADAVARQVAAQLRCRAPDGARAVIERQATIRCDPARPRFDADALAGVLDGIALAGDWCWYRYPATLESAVRSGDAAAAWIATGRFERA